MSAPQLAEYESVKTGFCVRWFFIKWFCVPFTSPVALLGGYVNRSRAPRDGAVRLCGTARSWGDTRLALGDSASLPGGGTSSAFPAAVRERPGRFHVLASARRCRLERRFSPSLAVWRHLFAMVSSSRAQGRESLLVPSGCADVLLCSLVLIPIKEYRFLFHQYYTGCATRKEPAWATRKEPAWFDALGEDGRPRRVTHRRALR